MAKLTTKQRKGLRASAFAVPSRRAFPITDKAHARAAIMLSGHARSPAERRAIFAKAGRMLGR